MKRDALVDELDRYFRTLDVRGDDWGEIFEFIYPEPYWREFVEPDYEGRWNGLMVRGGDSVMQAVTCVFPSDKIIRELAPGTFLFSEHPVDLIDEPGFVPIALASFERMVERGISFYHVHAPLDMHPEVAPSRLCAEAVGIKELEEYFPIAEGIPGGAAVIGDADHTLDELASALTAYLGDEIPVKVLTRPRAEAGRVAMVAGGGADVEILEASLERGCKTYVTGAVATQCRVAFVQEGIAAFLALADDYSVAIIDGTHYGMEKPPQLVMAEWFRARGLSAEFVPDGPK